jgi:hypothetical protein
LTINFQDDKFCKFDWSFVNRWGQSFYRLLYILETINKIQNKSIWISKNNFSFSRFMHNMDDFSKQKTPRLFVW